MKILFVIIIVVALVPIITIGIWLLSGFLNDGTDDTPEWQIRNLRIWKHTPVWDLALAVKRQDTAKIERIAKAHPKFLNYQESRYGATLLLWAVGVEKYKSVEALLKCGANPNIATPCSGETALLVAARYSWIDNQAKKDPKYVKLLLKYGADPNENWTGADDGITEPGTSPLMESILCGIEKTKALVEGGADINHKTASGKTAALLALWSGVDATDDAMEYAYYLIAIKKAKVTEPYLTMPADGSKPKSVAPIDAFKGVGSRVRFKRIFDENENYRGIFTTGYQILTAKYRSINTMPSW